MNLLVDAMRDGGFFMWPILAIAVVGSSVSLERLFYVYYRAGINAPAFMAQVQRAILDGDIDQALRLCAMEPNAALPRVLKAGLARASRPESEVRDAMKEARLELVPLIRRRTMYLPMFAHASILLGLLGTLQGVILALRSAGEASLVTRSVVLAEGTAVALHTLFFGLLVSIPLLVAQGFIAAQATAVLEELEHCTMKLVNMLNARRQRGGAHGGGAPVLPFPS